MDQQGIMPLDISVKKGVVNGAIYDILSFEDYIKVKNRNLTNIAINVEHENHKYILPVRNSTYSENTVIPGIYHDGPLNFYVYPTKQNSNCYEPKKVVELSNTDSMSELLEKKETLQRMAEPWILSPDNISIFSISPDDAPEMVALKEALNSKQIDFDKYAPRFGNNFPNDKRQLKNHSATLNIIKRFCESLDIEAELILKDKNPNVPNPMKKEIKVSLTDVTQNTIEQ